MDVHEEWREMFGEKYSLSTGDILSVSLSGDRSASISYNDVRFTDVFTDLPQTPLWVVIEMGVDQLEVMQPGIIYIL